MARTRRKTDLTVRVVAAAQDPEAEIRRIRKDIDTLDADILKLLSRRADEVLEIGRLKGGHPGAVYRPEREIAILKRLFAVNRSIPGGKLSDEAVSSLFREIISVCRSLEAPLTVAFFGQKTSYTHLAAIDLFGSCTNFLPQRTVGEVFDSVESQRSHHGIVPIENSTEGIVNVTLDTLLGSRLTIIQESYLLIHHCLLSREKNLKKVKRLYSHP
ncbi:MAG: chorismate mutase, partial [Spirochaetes bacterium]|nr:chorismate mutase [Spirochaetota bacterium]